MTSRATVTINTDADRAKVARWAQDTGIGTVVEFRKKSRSTEQNAKLHAMLSEVSEQVDWYGRKLSPTDWKNMFTASLQKANVVPGIDAGTVVTIGMSTSAMTIDEMSNLIELIYHFGAQPEHLVIFKDTPPVEPSSSTGSDESGSAPASSSEPDQTASDPGSNTDSAVDPSDTPTSPAESASLLPDDPALSVLDRSLLIECFAKFMDLTVRTTIDPAARREALVTAKDAWKGEIRPELHPKLAAMFMSADSIIRGKAVRDHVITEYAHFLDCAPEEIGG